MATLGMVVLLVLVVFGVVAMPIIKGFQSAKNYEKNNPVDSSKVKSFKQLEQEDQQE